jgi:hypothetical protein
MPMNGGNTPKSANGAAQESNLPSVGLPDLTGFEGLLEVQLWTEAGFRPASVQLDPVGSAETGTKSGTDFRR